MLGRHSTNLHLAKCGTKYSVGLSGTKKYMPIKVSLRKNTGAKRSKTAATFPTAYTQFTMCYISIGMFVCQSGGRLLLKS